MKKFFDYFKVPLIITLVISIVCIVIIANGSDGYVMNNHESKITANVFDYADNLTDAQEMALDTYISEVETQIGVDIAVVTLNQSLEEYYSGSASQWVMQFADDFADENMMGYDQAYGDSIVFVDNIFREPSTGKVYSWISTSGKAQDNMTSSDCEAIMDDALIYLSDDSGPDDYYAAYHKVVQLIPGYIDSTKAFANNYLKPAYVLAASLVLALIYVFANWKNKAGKRTTVSTTYVTNGHPNMTEKRDAFIRKTVTKTKRQQSSGGSGGHMSSGGHSHGGGGHSR